MALMLVFPSSLKAQGEFLFGVECNSGNLWSVGFLGIPTRFINAFILKLQGYDIEEMVGIPGSSFTYRYNRIKDNGQKVDYKGHNMFGFKAVDLFRDFEYSLKFGWQPRQLPVGFYARVGYRHENFQTRHQGNDNWTKHRINCLRPGLGIRVSPLENMVRKNGWCPIVDVGGYYDYYISYKGTYGNDKDQLNNGVSTYIGIGLKNESGTAFMLTFDNENYDLFNKDFTVDGVKPYADTKSTHFNISFSCSIGL
jgi:hypothetical protein